VLRNWKEDGAGHYGVTCQVSRTLPLRSSSLAGLGTFRRRGGEDRTLDTPIKS
jgi:hypothetical protein